MLLYFCTTKQLMYSIGVHYDANQSQRYCLGFCYFHQGRVKKSWERGRVNGNIYKIVTSFRMSSKIESRLQSNVERVRICTQVTQIRMFFAIAIVTKKGV